MLNKLPRKIREFLKKFRTLRRDNFRGSKLIFLTDYLRKLIVSIGRSSATFQQPQGTFQEAEETSSKVENLSERSKNFQDSSGNCQGGYRKLPESLTDLPASLEKNQGSSQEIQGFPGGLGNLPICSGNLPGKPENFLGSLRNHKVDGASKKFRKSPSSASLDDFLGCSGFISGSSKYSPECLENYSGCWGNSSGYLEESSRSLGYFPESSRNFQVS